MRMTPSPSYAQLITLETRFELFAGTEFGHTREGALQLKRPLGVIFDYDPSLDRVNCRLVSGPLG